MIAQVANKYNYNNNCKEDKNFNRNKCGLKITRDKRMNYRSITSKKNE